MTSTEGVVSTGLIHGPVDMDHAVIVFVSARRILLLSAGVVGCVLSASHLHAGMLNPFSSSPQELVAVDYTCAGSCAAPLPSEHREKPSVDEEVPGWGLPTAPDNTTTGTGSAPTGVAGTASAVMPSAVESPQHQLVLWAFQASHAPRRPPHVSGIFRPPRRVL